MSWKNIRIRNQEQAIKDLQDALGEAVNNSADQRAEIRALKKGVETTYEVITVSRTGTRNSRGFSERVDALHHATDLRIDGTLERRVTVNEIESRRQALLPNGDVIGRGFGT